MKELSDRELIDIGRTAAEQVTGPGSVEQIAVVSREDSTGQPGYFFSFAIDPRHYPQRPGIVLIDLIQRLRDALMARDDDHYPFIMVVGPDDWQALQGA